MSRPTSGTDSNAFSCPTQPFTTQLWRSASGFRRMAYKSSKM